MPPSSVDYRVDLWQEGGALNWKVGAGYFVTKEAAERWLKASAFVAPARIVKVTAEVVAEFEGRHYG